MSESNRLHFSTFKDWLLQEYTHNELADLCNQGAKNGFHGLIYYSETTALYNRYHEEIWDYLNMDRDDLGFSSCCELIASFTAASSVGSDTQFKNMLVWYSAEKIAFDITQGEYIDETEENDLNKKDD
jgi:hypothetical protein